MGFSSIGSVCTLTVASSFLSGAESDNSGYAQNLQIFGGLALYFWCWCCLRCGKFCALRTWSKVLLDLPAPLSACVGANLFFVCPFPDHLSTVPQA